MPSSDLPPGVAARLRPWRPPPRGELPPGVEIEKLPGLGTTWYERGIGYWLLRVLLTALMAIAVAVQTAILSGLFSAVRRSSPVAYYITVGVEVAYSVAILVYVAARYIQFRRHPQQGPARLVRPGSRRRTGATGGALGALAASGSVLAQLALIVGAVLTYGLTVAILLLSLEPVPDFERSARRSLAWALEDAESRSKGPGGIRHSPRRLRREHSHGDAGRPPAEANG